MQGGGAGGPVGPEVMKCWSQDQRIQRLIKSNPRSIQILASSNDLAEGIGGLVACEV